MAVLNSASVKPLEVATICCGWMRATSSKGLPGRMSSTAKVQSGGFALVAAPVGVAVNVIGTVAQPVITIATHSPTLFIRHPIPNSAILTSMKRALLAISLALMSCDGDELASTDAGTDATIDVHDAAVDHFASDASTDASADAPPDGYVNLGQCGGSIRPLDDAGVCHGSDASVNCVTEDPSFDHCVDFFLHDADGGSFERIECFDDNFSYGSCCNGTSASSNVLIDPTWTCCMGPAADGGTAACAPDAGTCTQMDAGFVCK